MKNNSKKDTALEKLEQYKLENQLTILGGKHQAHNPECFGYVPD
ncbi:hypothetical protein [uncultured Dokdonia sp.]|nr:hypothetical protein [uncultured Dokdonia sp.]